MASEKRLIDVQPFMKAGWHLVKTGKSNEYLASMSLADVPTVDAVEVVHGRWEYHWFDSYCSVCGWENRADRVTRCRDDYPYCPNCGAKMDGERKDDD